MSLRRVIGAGGFLVGAPRVAGDFTIIFMFNFFSLLGGIKYNKFTIRNQSIFEKNISSLMGPKSLLVKKKMF